jgi:hypothetical protein
MSNKSGFELRTDILGMAQSILIENRDQQTNAFYSRSDEERAGQQAPVIEISSEDVIAEARKLYAFVNEKV